MVSPPALLLITTSVLVLPVEMGALELERLAIRSCFTRVQVPAMLYNAVLVFFKTNDNLQREDG